MLTYPLQYKEKGVSQAALTQSDEEQQSPVNKVAYNFDRLTKNVNRQR